MVFHRMFWLSALTDMYAKCGRMHKARELFDQMHDANTISLNAMIGGYVKHGRLHRAFHKICGCE